MAHLAIGLSSGTSADGIDAALVQIAGKPLRVSLKAFQVYPYSNPLRKRLQKIFSPRAPLSETGEVNIGIAEEFSAAAFALLKKEKISPEAVAWIGSHGQTIFHQPPTTISGKKTSFTVQLGDGSVIAQRTGILTVSDFRIADMAQGGEGAPLVPYVDWRFYTDPKKSRVLLNIGGIANFTYLPPKGKAESVLACDTGPGNILINSLVFEITRGKRNQDQDGAWAAKGSVNQPLLSKLLAHPFLRKSLPKSAEREFFGKDLAQKILKLSSSLPAREILATATAFTAETISEHLVRYAKNAQEIYVSGGGIHNKTLMRFLQKALQEKFGPVPVERFDQLGIPAKAKEAVAFAFLAHETLQGIPSNLPQVTGARKPCVLGKISPGWRKTWKLL